MPWQKPPPPIDPNSLARGNCPDCKGTGEIQLLHSKVACACRRAASGPAPIASAPLRYPVRVTYTSHSSQTGGAYLEISWREDAPPGNVVVGGNFIIPSGVGSGRAGAAFQAAVAEMLAGVGYA